MIGVGELKVPEALRPVVEELVGITDAVCLAVLDDDRELLLGWREVVRGVFQIRERAGDAIIATRLGDEASYRIRPTPGQVRWRRCGHGAS